MATATPLTITVDATTSVSGLLQTPADARACYVLAHGAGAGMARTETKAQAVADVMALFDHVIESSKIGIRKPDPRIYQMACETLGVSPEACVYLDDLGINLKPAAALRMKTIKVVEPGKALEELQAAVGFPVG